MNNPEMQKILFEVLDNQLQANDPPETRETYERLVAEGRSQEEARSLVASVIGAEMTAVVQEQREFDREKFVKALRALPQLPPEA